MIDRATTTNADVIVVRSDRDVLVAEDRIAAAQNRYDIARVIGVGARVEPRGRRMNVLEVRAVVACRLETHAGKL